MARRYGMACYRRSIRAQSFCDHFDTFGAGLFSGGACFSRIGTHHYAHLCGRPYIPRLVKSNICLLGVLGAFFPDEYRLRVQSSTVLCYRPLVLGICRQAESELLITQFASRVSLSFHNTD